MNPITLVCFSCFHISELARKKKFLPAAIFKDEQQDRAGTQTLDAFKQHTIQERKLEELRDCGLTDEEISMGIGHTLKGTKLPKEPMVCYLHLLPFWFLR